MLHVSEGVQVKGLKSSAKGQPSSNDHDVAALQTVAAVAPAVAQPLTKETLVSKLGKSTVRDLENDLETSQNSDARQVAGDANESGEHLALEHAGSAASADSDSSLLVAAANVESKMSDAHFSQDASMSPWGYAAGGMLLGGAVGAALNDSNSSEVASNVLSITASRDNERLEVNLIEFGAEGDANLSWKSFEAVNVTASGENSDARFGGFTSYAYDSAAASVSTGKITVLASGKDSYAELNGLYAYASSSASAELLVGDVAATASGPGSYAYVRAFGAYAETSGAARVSVGDISIVASGADSSAYFYDIYASADYGDAQATVDIGDLTIRAAGTNSQATMRYISAYANYYGSGSASASVNIDSVSVIASGQDSYASLYYLYMSAQENGQSTINMGDVTILAEGTRDTNDSNTAYWEYGYVEAFDSATASLNMDSLSIIARGESGLAQVYSLYAYAEDSASTSLSIGSLLVEATTEGSEAYLSNLSADARDSSSVMIDIGDVTVRASAANSGAYLSYMTATAYNSATATIDMDSLSLIASGVDSGVSAYFSYVWANNVSSTANVSVGDIRIEASAEGANASLTLYAWGSGEVNVSLGDVTFDYLGGANSADRAAVYIDSTHMNSDGVFNFSMGDVFVEGDADGSVSSDTGAVTIRLDAADNATETLTFTVNDSDITTAADLQKKMISVQNFDGTDDTIVFNEVDGSATNYAEGSDDNFADLFAAANTALDGTVMYYYGYDTVAGVGYLFYDGDGTGVTSLVALNGVDLTEFEYGFIQVA